MNIPLFEQLHRDGFIESKTLAKVKAYDKKAPVSVHWDLLTLLYAGIFLLTTGLGIIIYKNIDSIGHIAVTISIAIGCAACFFYCIRHAKGFSFNKVESPNVWFDYILLLGCSLMLILIGYLQFQFQVFGNRWGMAIFVPMVILFIAAYYFDHIGVLSMAITNLATWVGIAVTPLHLLKDNDFRSSTIIYSAIGLGICLIIAGVYSSRQKIKEHFSFTYKNFGTHLLFIASLSAVFRFSELYLLWFLFLAGICFYYFTVAVKEKSFYFLVITAIYFYIALGYVVIRLLLKSGAEGDGSLYLSLIYLILSAVGLVALLMRYNKSFNHVSIQ
jgi:hypothetical protein